jgi:hypothetical protein
MTEITPQTQGTAPVGMLPAVAKPPDGEFAERLTQAQKAQASSRANSSSADDQQGKAATKQSNTVSQDPDPQKSKSARSGNVASVAKPIVPCSTPATMSLPLAAQPKTTSTNQVPPTLVLVDASSIVTEASTNSANTKSTPSQTATDDVPAQSAPGASQTAQIDPATAVLLASAVLTASASGPLTTTTAVVPSAPSETGTSTPQISMIPSTESAELTASVGQTQSSATLASSGRASKYDVQDAASSAGTVVVPANTDSKVPSGQTNQQAPSGTEGLPPMQDLNTLKQSFSDVVSARSFHSNTTSASSPESGAAKSDLPATPLTPGQTPAQVSANAATQVTAATVSGSINPALASPGDSKDGVAAHADGATAKASSTINSKSAPTGSAPIDPPAVSPTTMAGQADGDADEDSDPSDASGVAAPVAAKSKTSLTSEEADSLSPSASTPTSATAAVSQGAPVSGPAGSNIDKGQLASQVADHIQLLAVTQQKDGVVVHLEPADLGSITLVVRAVASNVTAQVTASDEHVRSALEQSRDQLGAQLQARGYHLTSVSVGSAGASSGLGSNLSDGSKGNSNAAGLWQGTQQQAQQQQQARAATNLSARSAAPVASGNSISQTSSTALKGLDVWI